MKKNMGQLDRVARSVLALIALFFVYNHIVTGIAAIAFLVIAAVFMLTSILAVCPLYTVLGIRTCQAKHT